MTRISPDPYLRVDTNDYSLDPTLVGRRVEVRVEGDTFEQVFAKQLTWAPIRRAVEAVGREAFLDALRPRLIERTGSAEPTSLDLSCRVVSGDRPD